MSLISVIAASSTPGAPSNPSAIVAGAGTSAANGTYSYRGTFDSGQGIYPYYNLIGQPSDPTLSAISDQGGGDPGTFGIYAANGDPLYSQLTGGNSFPWENSWQVISGTEPAPTVTQS